MKRSSDIALSLLLVIGASGWFLLSTLLLDQVPDALLVLGISLGALALATVTTLPTAHDLRSLSLSEVISAALGGVLVLVVSPLLVLANRFTDAPPGSETLFFTTSAWALIALGVAAATRDRRPTLGQLSFTAIGVLGGAAVLANWERPSSFSPFVRYPWPEIAFLVAGLAWLVGARLLLGGSKERARSDASLTVAAAAAAIASAAWLVASGGLASLTRIGDSGAALLAASVAYAVVFVTWLLLARQVRMPAASALWLLPPAAITLFGVFEQWFSPRGPDPVVWPGALAGIALALLGALGAWLARTAEKSDDASRTARSAAGLVSVGVSAAALLLGLVTLSLPAIGASVKGTLSSGAAYSVSWSLLGFETAGGWIPVVAGALLLSAALDALRVRRPVRMFSLAAAGALVLGTYPLLASTPLHTWTRWVPVEIQSEYGTEYTLLQFATVHDPVRLVALALGVLAVVALLGLGASQLGSRKNSIAPSEVPQ